ncbi:MAG TPA: PIN domain-containing protein [Dehalococcoidia bacterium]|nr:PIN domain-containing protein [Dehalococcoidia bacterium]
MSIDRATIVFFDASALFAAALSPTGGAGLILSVCERGLLAVTTSQAVLEETERDLEVKRPGPAWYRLSRRIANRALRVLPTPSAADHHPAINRKDAHVYAAAIAASSEYLITLDRELIREVNAIVSTPMALLPGEFITQCLIFHPSYGEIEHG